MQLAARLDDYGKPAWIALMIVAFIVFWPAGLALLGYLIWSGRMGCSKRGFGRWYGCHGKGNGEGRSGRRFRDGSGNTAFDEYREATLRRLEEEQDEFHAFLDRLRRAKDKAEFDQFMADRRRPDAGSKDEPGPTPDPAG